MKLTNLDTILRLKQQLDEYTAGVRELQDDCDISVTLHSYGRRFDSEGTQRRFQFTPETATRTAELRKELILIFNKQCDSIITELNALGVEL